MVKSVKLTDSSPTNYAGKAMNVKNSFRLTTVLLAAVLAMATTASAQDKPVEKSLTKAPAVQSDSKATSCFADDDPIVDHLAKHPTSHSEQQIINKIIHFVTHGYTSQMAAFSDLDHDHNCKLDKSEVSDLLRKSHINGIIRLFATGRLINRYDVSHDGYVQWREFHFAIDKALKKQAKQKAKKLQTAATVSTTSAG